MVTIHIHKYLSTWNDFGVVIMLISGFQLFYFFFCLIKKLVPWYVQDLKSILLTCSWKSLIYITNWLSVSSFFCIFILNVVTIYVHFITELLCKGFFCFFFRICTVFILNDNRLNIEKGFSFWKIDEWPNVSNIKKTICKN